MLKLGNVEYNVEIISKRIIFYEERKREYITMKKFLILLLAAIILCIGINIVQNSNVQLSSYTISSKKITDDFNGYKILQLSDLHSLQSEKLHKKMMAIVLKEEPDIIVITGDLVDAAKYREEQSAFWDGTSSVLPGKNMLSIVEELLTIAPVYYIYGNHEMILLNDPEKNTFKVAVEEAGAILLNNKSTQIKRGNSVINLLGIQDPSTLYKDERFAYLETREEQMNAMLTFVTKDISKDNFTLLLSHRPEYIDIYSEYAIDLTLSGHAHGGQFRLPFIGGLYAPNQGFFPKYDKGLYTSNDSELIVSTGIGNSVIPFRIFNTPEIVSVKLQSLK